jgi:hypothetical protein
MLKLPHNKTPTLNFGDLKMMLLSRYIQTCKTITLALKYLSRSAFCMIHVYYILLCTVYIIIIDICMYRYKLCMYACMYIIYECMYVHNIICMFKWALDISYTLWFFHAHDIYRRWWINLMPLHRLSGDNLAVLLCNTVPVLCQMLRLSRSGWAIQWRSSWIISAQGNMYTWHCILFRSYL